MPQRRKKEILSVVDLTKTVHLIKNHNACVVSTEEKKLTAAPNVVPNILAISKRNIFHQSLTF
jgi:hypothetical protein